jgi:transposase-like protein
MFSKRKSRAGRPSKYPPEFRRDAVGLVLDEGRGSADVARSLGTVGAGALGNWVRLECIERGGRPPSEATRSRRPRHGGGRPRRRRSRRRRHSRPSWMTPSDTPRQLRGRADEPALRLSKQRHRYRRERPAWLREFRADEGSMTEVADAPDALPAHEAGDLVTTDLELEPGPTCRLRQLASPIDRVVGYVQRHEQGGEDGVRARSGRGRTGLGRPVGWRGRSPRRCRTHPLQRPVSGVVQRPDHPITLDDDGSLECRRSRSGHRLTSGAETRQNTATERHALR